MLLVGKNFFQEFEQVLSDGFFSSSLYVLIKMEKYLNKIRPYTHAISVTLQQNHEHNENKAFLVYVTP